MTSREPPIGRTAVLIGVCVTVIAVATSVLCNHACAAVLGNDRRSQRRAQYRDAEHRPQPSMTARGDNQQGDTP